MTRSSVDVKLWQELSTPRGRKAQQAFLAEGPRLIEEACRAGLWPESVLYDEARRDRFEGLLADLARRGIPLIALGPKNLARISQTEQDQGIAARFPLPPPLTLETLLAQSELAVIVDGVQDPGNVGAILRHAAAFGADSAIFLPGSADPFGPKVVRASMGGLLSLKIASVPEAPPKTAHSSPTAPAALHLRCALEATGLAPWVLRAEGGQSLWTTRLPPRLALVVGSEAHGPGAAWEGAPSLYIPQTDRVESCNAAFAAAVVLAKRFGDRPQGRSRG